MISTISLTFIGLWITGDVLFKVIPLFNFVVAESTEREPFPNPDNTRTGNRENCKTFIILALKTGALAPLTLRSLILSTGQPAACFANARAAWPGLGVWLYLFC